jgi:peptide/nickel transport system substrate-binding protein
MKTWSRGLAQMALAAVSALLLSAAHAASLDAVTTVTNNGVAPPSNINSLLPVVNNDSAANNQAVTLMYRPLLWIGNDLRIDWQESLAQSITVSPDRKTFTITLKPWRWSDGRLVTAQDAVDCYRLIQQFGDSYPNAGIGGIPGLISDFSALAPDRLEVKLKRPVNPFWFELNGLSQIVPVPAFAWKGLTANTLYARQTDPSLVRVTDGPYKLERFIQGREADFVSNPSFSGPKPQFSRLTFRMITSPESAFWSLKTGNLQVANVPHALSAAGKKIKHLGSCITNGGYAINYVALNFTNPKVAFLRDVRVRQALQAAINQPQMIRVAYHGNGEPSFGPVPTTPDTYLSTRQKWLVKHPMHAFNPGKARSLLDRAGWHVGADGIRVKNGQRLAFTMMVRSDSLTHTAEAEILQQQWHSIGVEMHILSLPFNLELVKLHPNGDWDAGLVTWSYSPDFYPTGDGMFDTGGGVDYGGYSNPTVDRLIAASTQTSSTQSLDAYEDFISQNLPVLFLPTPGYLVKFDRRLSPPQVQAVVWQATAHVVSP